MWLKNFLNFLVGIFELVWFWGGWFFLCICNVFVLFMVLFKDDMKKFIIMIVILKRRRLMNMWLNIGIVLISFFIGWVFIFLRIILSWKESDS